MITKKDRPRHEPPAAALRARGKRFTRPRREKSHAGRFSKGLTQIAGKEPAEAI